MPTDQRLRRNLKTIGPASFALISLIAADPSAAEIKIITATGEYRMGDNDTRTDAKRLALLDAKRLALEQAGTYLESVTEIKNLSIARDELNAYTAGIVEVTELDTKDVLDGATHVIRVQVTAKIDTDVVARQMDALRKNETAKAELVRLRTERDQLRMQVEAKNKELAQTKSKSEANKVQDERSKLLMSADNSEMDIRAILLALQDNEHPGSLSQAKQIAMDLAALNPSSPDSFVTLGFIYTVSKDYRKAAEYYRKAIELDPRVAKTHYRLAGVLLALGKRDEAVNELEAAIKLDPTDAEAHAGLGVLLEKDGKTDEAVKEMRKASYLVPHDATYHGVLGRFLENQGRTLETLAEYENSLELVHSNRFENLDSDENKILGIRHRIRQIQKGLHLGKLNCEKEFYALSQPQRLRVFESVASVDDLYLIASREVRKEVKNSLLSQTAPPGNCSEK